MEHRRRFGAPPRSTTFAPHRRRCATSSGLTCAPRLPNRACLHLGIPLPDSDEAEWHGHGDDEGFLEGEGEDREYYDDDGEPSLEEDDDAHQDVDEEFRVEGETHGFCDDEMLHEEIVEERSHLCNDDELSESPITGYGLEEGGSDADGTSNSNDMVYMINKVMVLAVAMTWST
ncbi:hypothetical protein ZWY2020_029165 [Hordeum vulgare]|nr:hypothetical protein ZWY2020_029165 [Hordeum vulgare]